MRETVSQKPYSTSCELKDDSIAEGGERVTPFENQLEKEPDFVQLSSIGQQEFNPALVSRPIESDDSTGSYPDESSLRDSPRGESLDREPMLQKPRRAGKGDFRVTGGHNKNKYGAIRNQLVL